MAGGTVKKKSLLVFVLMATAIFLVGSHLAWGQFRQELDPGNHGKVIVQVADDESGASIQEKFVIEIFSCDEVEPLGWLKTDESGHMERFFNVGTYCFVFLPDSETSKYAIEPSFEDNPEYKHMVKVERNKITRIIKKAHIGGKLLIRLVDPEGVPIDPSYFSKSFSAAVRVRGSSSPRFIEILKSKYNPDLSPEEFLIRNLYPGHVEIEISFFDFGCPDLNGVKAEVLKGQKTELNVKVDLNSKTGVMVQILDANGIPPQEASVDLDDVNQENVGFCRNMGNGFFKMVGIKPGKYQLNCSATFENSPQISHKSEIVIRDGHLITKVVDRE